MDGAFLVTGFFLLRGFSRSREKTLLLFCLSSPLPLSFPILSSLLPSWLLPFSLFTPVVFYPPPYLLSLPFSPHLPPLSPPPSFPPLFPSFPLLSPLLSFSPLLPLSPSSFYFISPYFFPFSPYSSLSSPAFPLSLFPPHPVSLSLLLLSFIPITSLFFS